MSQLHALPFFGILAATFAAGCGSDYPETIPVTGTVTLDGQPVPEALITFMPTDGKRSGSGETDAEGRFTLTTYAPNDGAVPGSHQIAIYPKNPPPMPGERPGPTSSMPTNAAPQLVPFPDKYGLPQQSGFTADVTPDGENDFTFEMKSKG